MLKHKDSKKRKARRRRAIATVFFRFSHRDKDGKALVNKEQNKIVELLKNDIMAKQQQYWDRVEEVQAEMDLKNIEDAQKEVEEEKAEETKTEKDKQADDIHHQSATYIPYYDKIPRDNTDDDEFDFELVGDEGSGNFLGPIEGKDNKNEETKASFEAKPLRLPKSENQNRFMPTCSGKSSIMSDTQIMVIARLLPPLFRMREWSKVYSIDEDGVSLQTFYK